MIRWWLQTAIGVCWWLCAVAVIVGAVGRRHDWGTGVAWEKHWEDIGGVYGMKRAADASEMSGRLMLEASAEASEYPTGTVTNREHPSNAHTGSKLYEYLYIPMIGEYIDLAASPKTFPTKSGFAVANRTVQLGSHVQQHFVALIVPIWAVALLSGLTAICLHIVLRQRMTPRRGFQLNSTAAKEEEGFC